ncbi:cystatin-B-like [Dermatophagoides pteronyssinus]|uniref:cystatin-B-like n=1 Tax=Dermatophagoides pteronyssinus TaxID=6956 RepID=UPI003F67ED76
MKISPRKKTNIQPKSKSKMSEMISKYNKDSKPMMCGGLASESTEISDHVREMVKKFQPKIEAKFGRKLERFEPVKIRTQVVAGINYFIKCHIGGDDYVHIRIYEPLPCMAQEPELTAIHSELKKLDDPLEYFQH